MQAGRTGSRHVKEHGAVSAILKAAKYVWHTNSFQCTASLTKHSSIDTAPKIAKRTVEILPGPIHIYYTTVENSWGFGI